MQYYNQRQMFGSCDDDMVNQLRHDLSWGILVGRQADASACVECRQCEEACTQRLNIVDRLAQISEWEKKVAAN
jgi:predicted aldo/keto reductase-like oxidoreductase